MRSEVVRMHREMCSDTLHPVGETAGMVLGRLLPEINFASASKLVRISVEILDEKGEEKVWSKVTIRRHEGGARGACMNAAGGWEYLLEAITKDWQPGESRKVKSILFETPSGVPVVEFVETPRERLVNAVKAFDGGGLLESDIVRRVKDYLAATEGEK